MTYTTTPTHPPTPSYGGAKQYFQENSSEVNCLGYAWGIPEFVSVEHGQLTRVPSNSETAGDYFNAVVGPYLTTKNMSYRALTGKTSYVSDTEYRIAMRICEAYAIGFLTISADCHFWVQTTSTWAQKSGETVSEQLSATADPDETTNWDIASDPTTGTPYYYKASTYYFAKTVRGVNWYD